MTTHEARSLAACSPHRIRRRRAGAGQRSPEVLHWWTSGGEAAALNVLKGDLEKEGVSWKDVPVAGGGGDAAMTALKAMVAAGNPPTAVQMLGFDDPRLGQQGVLGDLNEVRPRRRLGQGRSGGAAEVLEVQGQVGRRSGQRPLGQLAVDQQGGAGQDRRPPSPRPSTTSSPLLDKRKGAGVIPLALGGQTWQEATMFDGVVLSTGGPEFYKKAFIDLDDEALKSDTMKKAFDNLAQAASLVDPNFSGRDWNLATAMVIKGDAGLQVMGDWAKGEFVAAKKVPGKDFLCFRFPGTDGTRDLQLRHVRHVQRAGRPHGCPGRARQRRSWTRASSRRSTS